MSRNNKPEKVPQKIAVILTIMGLAIILSAKEFFQIHVQGLADQLNMSLSDTWLAIIIVVGFGMVFITWFFTSIRIERKK